MDIEMTTNVVTNDHRQFFKKCSLNVIFRDKLTPPKMKDEAKNFAANYFSSKLFISCFSERISKRRKY